MTGPDLLDPCGLPTDEALLECLSRGDAETGLSGLQERYGARIHHFVHGIVRDGHLAQDVTQDVLQKVLCKHGLYEPGTNFRAWLFEVARNQALSALRRRQRAPRPVGSLTSGDGGDDFDPIATLMAGPEDRSMEEREFMAAFQRAVDELPEHYRTVFELCVRQGRPYLDAGRELGLPTGTVAIRIMRARKRLFSALSRHLGRLRRPPACFQ